METDAAILSAIVMGAGPAHGQSAMEEVAGRELRREANEIGGLAETETRPRVRDEMLKQVTAYERAALHCSLDAALESCISNLGGRPNAAIFQGTKCKMLKAFARKGHQGAQEILENRLFLAQESENNLPISKRLARWIP